MKKLLISLFSFMLILAGGILSANSFTSFADDSITELFVTDAKDFVTYLSAESTYNNENIKITLKDNIDFTDVDLSPISEIKGIFKGIFDGDGYSISNINISSKNQYFGLIPQATDATIQNIKISGNINFTFDSTNTKEIYAGVLVGKAQNVIFSNCEFDAPAEANEIVLPIYSDFNFGLLAGKLQGNPLANSSGNPANVKDVVNYYNIKVELNKQSNIYVGGLIGNLQNSYILNTLNQGKIVFENKLTNGGDSANTNKQYIGGVTGVLSGSGTHVRNSVFGGSIEVTSVVTTLEFYKGAILGGLLATGTSGDNINFNYWVDATLYASGDNFITSGEKIKLIELINKPFLTDTNNFDQQSQNAPFNFNTVWNLSESRYHLQRFMTFTFNFKSVLNNTIESAKFYLSDGVSSDTFTAKYDKPVRIDLKLKEEFVGYYKLSGMTLSNLDFDMDNAIVEPITNNKGKEEGYSIYVKANAITSGSYGFDIQSITYNCVATISDEAKAENQGGVRISDNNITTPTDEMNIQFTYNSAVKKIVAEGENGSVFAFDCWKLYYKDDATGEYFADEIPFENSTDSELSISFGTAPFDREFKLVAYFTDENAILVNFGEANSKYIKSIKFSGITYTGLPIAVSPNQSKNLEIVTTKGYKLNVKAFEDFVKILYGDNSTETLIVSDPEVNAEGETTYKFSLNMKYVGEVKNNTLAVQLQIDEDDSNSSADLLWLWITIPCAGVLLIGLVIFIIVRHKRGGGKGGKGGKVGKVKVKKESYKDYY